MISDKVRDEVVPWWNSHSSEEKYHLLTKYHGLRTKESVEQWWHNQEVAGDLDMAIAKIYGYELESDPRKRALYTILAV